MKKFFKIKIAIFFIFSIILFGHKIYAVNTQIELIGENEVEAGEKQTINVEITSEDTIGVIEGIIKCDSNIDIFKITNSYNGWTATYNESNGKFNIFNAQGCTEGAVLQITYVMKESAENATISLNNLNLTTIEYDTIELGNKVTKTINRVKKNEEPSEEEPSEQEELSEEEKTSEEEKLSTYEPKKVDDTTSKVNLPSTGIPKIIIAGIIVPIFGVITYLKKRKYKNIK